MSDYKALIVDFGGVLTTPLQDSFVMFSEALGIELQDLVRVALKAYTGDTDQLVIDFETGAISDEEFSKQFAQRLSDETGVEVDADGLVERMFGGMRLEEGMLDAVEAAKHHGFQTALLSNSWGLGGYPRERLAAIMDVIVISGEVGMRKPDPQIFELTTGKLGLEPAECVFVDDHPGHLKSAQEVGMKTVLHREPAETIAALEDLFGVSLSGS
ncbi:MAG: putative hydrolase of the superfamily [Actinomycetota bacterium]|jgi:epoxide hydrolase-like predicted phosphatase|nr:putative hydrolase of the superfamily [Actinomycetota bacterium]